MPLHSRSLYIMTNVRSIAKQPQFKIFISCYARRRGLGHQQCSRAPTAVDLVGKLTSWRGSQLQKKAKKPNPNNQKKIQTHSPPNHWHLFPDTKLPFWCSSEHENKTFHLGDGPAHCFKCPASRCQPIVKRKVKKYPRKWVLQQEENRKSFLASSTDQ